MLDRLKREELPRISRETGLHIVAGTSFYVDPLIPEEVKLMTVEEVQRMYASLVPVAGPFNTC